MSFLQRSCSAVVVPVAAVAVLAVAPAADATEASPAIFADVHASAVSWGQGRIDVFYRGTDATLRHSWTSDGVQYLDESLRGVVVGEPRAVAPGAVSWRSSSAAVTDSCTRGSMPGAGTPT